MGLARLSKNGQLVQTLDGINSRVHFFRVIYLEGAEWRDDAYAEHGRIIAALRHRAVDEGMRIVEQHATISLANAMEVTKEGLARIYMGPDR
jgi:DNA-binding FadR family transcriptional regulator